MNKYCSNCKKKGHINKKCRIPITSYGIICFKRNDFKSLSNINQKVSYNKYNLFNEKNKLYIKQQEKINFLIIQRKDSLAFSEFVMVKYNIKNSNYITKLFINMTNKERSFLYNVKDPNEIWIKFWSNKPLNKNNKKINKLKQLIEGLNDFNNIFFNIKSLIEQTKTKRKNPEWGFPKGKKNIMESNINCALREFFEETNIHHSNINILKNIDPFEETFIGSNNIKYKHVYYIAELKNDIKLEINKNNFYQVTEISDINFFEKKKIIKKLEKKNSKRINIFLKVYNYINFLIYIDYLFT